MRGREQFRAPVAVVAHDAEMTAGVDGYFCVGQRLHELGDVWTQSVIRAASARDSSQHL